MRLRYRPAAVQRFVIEVPGMEESSTYQAIIEEGRAQGFAEGRILAAREVLLRLGFREFGEPDDTVRARVESLSDFERLKRLVERVRDAGSWADLFSER